MLDREDAKKELKRILEFDLSALDWDDNQQYDMWCAYDTTRSIYKNEGEDAALDYIQGKYEFKRG